MLGRTFAIVSALLAAAAGVAQLLDRVEIDGPVRVAENVGANYRCWAHFTDGQRLDVTDNAVWEVDQPRFAWFIAPGRLHAADVPGDLEVVIRATYTFGNRTRSDEHGIDVEDGALLWDNGFISNSGEGTGISPPAFPNIRVADDIVVPSPGWFVEGMMYLVHEDGGWSNGGVTEVFVYGDDGEFPGGYLFNAFAGHHRFATGRTYFGRAEFRYFTRRLRFLLPPGRYWVGARHPNASGSGTAYWEEGQSVRERRYSVSLDAGRTWGRGVRIYDPVFQLRGVPIRVTQLDGFQVTQGYHVAGSLLALLTSDDRYVVIGTVKQDSLSLPAAQIEVQGSAGNHPLSFLSVGVEASAFDENLGQRIEMFNFTESRWVRLDERPAFLNDERLDLVLPGNPRDWVHPFLGTFRVRIGYVDWGVSAATAFARVDHVEFIAAG